MKRTVLVVAGLVLLSSCGGGSSAPKADQLCTDFKTLVDSGSKVLDEKDKWKPLVEKAAQSDDTAIKASGSTMKQLLAMADKGSKNVTNASFNNALAKLSGACAGNAVTFHPPTTAPSTST